MPHLPQELIDAILENVPDESLNHCSLTATAFVPTSQRRLFRWMSLADLPSFDRTVVLLTSSPHLAKYFLYLAVNIKVIPDDFTSLKLILPQLTELERFTVVGNVGLSGNQIERNPRLLDVLSLPTLKSFGVQDVGDLPAALVRRVLSSFEQVVLSRTTIFGEDAEEELELSRVTPRTSGSPRQELEESPRNLWHLIVVFDYALSTDPDFESITSWVLDPKRSSLLRQIRRLSFTSPPVPELVFPRLRDLLVATSGTLRHLELELDAPPPALPTLPTLTALDVILDVELTKNPNRLNSIVYDTVASMPHLEVLTIAFLDRPFGVPTRNQWLANRPWAWADLDSTLTDMPCLREANLSLRNFGTEPDERFLAFAHYMQVHLPRAFDAGLIKFSSKAHSQHPMDRFVLE
ncbi:hypothetical protein C8R46DRAFT_1299944 [Mycena filopes]|nr:hypothetical protein C8R46DRAFT_1299944 [Mycena filopes]